MWVPVPPSSLAALAGATVLVNLSGRGDKDFHSIPEAYKS